MSKSKDEEEEVVFVNPQLDVTLCRQLIISYFEYVAIVNVATLLVPPAVSSV